MGIRKKGMLPFMVKLGYGMGQFGEGIAYSFFYYFYTYFLVTIIGVSPSVAGALSAFAVFWDAVTDPLIGFLSDRSKSVHGRRRGFIGKAAVPLGVAIALLCWKPPLDGAALIIYIIIVNLLFWLFFTCCDIPWIILGNEITDDFDEKTRVRSIATGFLYVGQLISAGLSLPAVAFLAQKLGSELSGWKVWGVIMGALACAAFLIAFLATKGRDKPFLGKETVVKEAKQSFLQTAKECLSVKGFIPLISLTIVETSASGVFCSGSIFLLTITYGFSEGQASVYNIVTSILAFALAYVIGWLATKLDKRSVLGTMCGVGAVGLIIVWLLPDAIPILFIATLIYFMADTSFWTLVFALLGDVTELDGYMHGKDREGVVSSFVSVGTKLGYAIGMWLFGIGLDFVGYSESATVVTAQISSGVRTIFFVPIAVFFALCVLCVGVYPYSRKKYNKIKSQYVS